MTHPAPESLARQAVGAGDADTARHVEHCLDCRVQMLRFREAAELLHVLPGAARTAECLDETALADFVEGRLTPDARAPVVAHLLECGTCRAAVAAIGRLLADSGVAREIARVETSARPRRWHGWSVAAGLAAAALLVVVVWPAGDEGQTLREPTLTSTIAPVPIMPRASVPRVDRLVWSSVPRAQRYRLRIYDTNGSVVWTAETADTVALLPDSVAFGPGVTYFWRVEAEADWQRWTASDLVEFQVTAPAQ